jgi:hypothetical protein
MRVSLRRSKGLLGSFSLSKRERGREEEGRITLKRQMWQDHDDWAQF